MKKGCFLISITVLTILVGAGIYLYKKYWPEIQNFGKEKIISKGIEEIEAKLAAVEYSVFKDSISVLLKQQSKMHEHKNFEKAMEEFGSLLSQTRIFIEDGVIDSVEFIALKNMVKKNERPEKNRN